MPDTALVPQQPAAGDEFLSIIAGAAADPRVDVAKMQALLDMRLQLMRENAASEFAAAMARLQPRLPRILKSGMVDFTSQKTGVRQQTPYARYEDILKFVRPLLAEEGFSVSYSFADGPKGTTCTCTVSHRAGHSKATTTPPLPMDASGSKNAVQAVGSTMSYAKRYALCNALDIVTVDQDDDANGSNPLTDAEHGKLTELIEACGLDRNQRRMAAFLAFAGAKSVDAIQRQDFDRCLEALNGMYAAVQKAKEKP
jgi:hypothetical protein